MVKTYGGWSEFGEPQWDNSSVSGGKPVPQNSIRENTRAARNQSKVNAILNCRKCKKLPSGAYCGKHASDASKYM